MVEDCRSAERAVSLTIEPARKQELMLERTKRVYGPDGHYLTAVRKAMEEGFGMFAIHPPAKRLIAYTAMTWPEDKYLILTDNYFDLWKIGQLPDLHALTSWQEAGRPMPDPNTGLPMMPPPVTDIKPFFWAWLLPPNLPAIVFENYAGDYRALVKAEGAK